MSTATNTNTIAELNDDIAILKQIAYGLKLIQAGNLAKEESERILTSVLDALVTVIAVKEIKKDKHTEIISIH